MSGFHVPTSAEFFRSVNDRIFELGASADGLTDLICECPDGECTGIIMMRPDEFDAMRSEPGLHAVVPGHEESVSGVIVAFTDRYVLVRIPARAPQSEVAA
jgi:hypothetical protein